MQASECLMDIMSNLVGDDGVFKCDSPKMQCNAWGRLDWAPHFVLELVLFFYDAVRKTKQKKIRTREKNWVANVIRRIHVVIFIFILVWVWKKIRSHSDSRSFFWVRWHGWSTQMISFMRISRFITMSSNINTAASIIICVCIGTHQ